MNVKTVKTIVFSPTRTTKHLVAAVAAGLGAESVKAWDLTLPDAKVPSFGKGAGDVAVIGVPVYAGRIPAVAAERLRAMQGWGSLAVLVVTYGNRHYDDALIELTDLAEELGFTPVAGGAFVAEHSFSTPELPVAEGRPDMSDTDKATAFGEQVATKITELPSAADCAQLEVPGNRPYKEGWNKPPMSPTLDESLCTGCGECASVCPTGAISINGKATTDSSKCIVCAACTRACPEQGRSFKGTPIADLNVKIHELFSERREPELFI
ncbi:4Fe-4S binding protein [Desulfovibrio ferrophilus]|uniref:4Fe-4S ferredoxin, iron-sulfur binding domain protein n=1 Tax=Desulfovibrio ferrophilus TaxID=241368 RepID=A0A2Z6AWY9_9BACT|nr:4Fe-4S binding protein [Desulfovibrio ferrophilus]BBD07725.1 4Fe-4S ferredoxin, iron-sulfur binding domain protein [Desulfovibrio ferrophilus]